MIGGYLRSERIYALEKINSYKDKWFDFIMALSVEDKFKLESLKIVDENDKSIDWLVPSGYHIGETYPVVVELGKNTLEEGTRKIISEKVVSYPFPEYSIISNKGKLKLTDGSEVLYGLANLVYSR